VLRAHGQIDYLINNAGTVHDRTALKMSVLDWEQVIRVDLSGPFFMSKAVLGHFLERGSGRIVNTSSFVGQTGRIGQANYSAAKAGLFGLTKTLALETAGKGITVNCILPGAIETDMVAALPGNIVQAVVDTIPMRALGRPEDVAEAVRYLVSDEARYVTGALLPDLGSRSRIAVLPTARSGGDCCEPAQGGPRLDLGQRRALGAGIVPQPREQPEP
jgi:acetoacetyl-CoA reductase